MTPAASSHPRRAALFLDRDGILNKVVVRSGVVSSPRKLAEFQLFPETIALMEAARSRSLVTVVVTNQPDIARGLLDPAELLAMHALLQSMLSPDAIEVCPTSDETDPRRKPNPGMLLDAGSRFHLDLARSYFLGDSLKDLQAGRRAGVTTLYLKCNHNSPVDREFADHTFSSLAEVTKFILQAP